MTYSQLNMLTRRSRNRVEAPRITLLITMDTCACDDVLVQKSQQNRERGKNGGDGKGERRARVFVRNESLQGQYRPSLKLSYSPAGQPEPVIVPIREAPGRRM